MRFFIPIFVTALTFVSPVFGAEAETSKIWMPEDLKHSSQSFDCEDLFTNALKDFKKDSEEKKANAPVLTMLHDLLQSHPKVTDSELFRTLRWFMTTQHLEDMVLKIHLSDWLKQLKFSEASAIESLREHWPLMSLAQKGLGVAKLLNIISESRITKLFDNPEQWAVDADFIKKLEFDSSEVQEFNRRWKRMTAVEQELFLLVTISDELPGILSSFLPVVIKNNQMVLSQEAVNMKRVPVSVGVRGKLLSQDLMVDEGLVKMLAQSKSLALASWFRKVSEFIDQAEIMTFEDVLYFFSQAPRKTKNWYSSGHTFQSITSAGAQSLGGFAHTESVRSEDGKVYEVGRLGTVNKCAIDMLMMIQTPLSQDQYDTLLRYITNGREQVELHHRLKKRFGISY